MLFSAVEKNRKRQGKIPEIPLQFMNMSATIVEGEKGVHSNFLEETPL